MFSISLSSPTITQKGHFSLCLSFSNCASPGLNHTDRSSVYLLLWIWRCGTKPEQMCVATVEEQIISSTIAQTLADSVGNPAISMWSAR